MYEICVIIMFIKLIYNLVRVSFLGHEDEMLLVDRSHVRKNIPPLVGHSKDK